MAKRQSGFEQFSRAVAAGLRARSRFVVLSGDFIVMVGPDGLPLPRTINETRKDAIAALGPELAPGWRRRGYRPIPIRLAAPITGKVSPRSRRQGRGAE